MQWHIEQAVAAGAGFDEVLEAVEVGIEMGGGPATVSARFALEVLDSRDWSSGQAELGALTESSELGQPRRL